MDHVNFLHFSDLHVGVAGLETDWPTIRHDLENDLAYLHELSGPWDLVIFTGDLAFSGQESEYGRVRLILEDLWETFADLGCDPKLLAIPGNHDLALPGRDSIAYGLHHSWDDAHIREDFWQRDGDLRRAAVIDAFAQYSAWWADPGVPALSADHAGVLPGDFVATVAKGETRLGVVALNTTFLQLQLGMSAGTLAVDPRQIQSAAGGDLTKWAKQHDLFLLITHQPPGWLREDAREILETRVVHPWNPALHMFGHEHAADQSADSRRGNPTRRRLQGAALFGLERWGMADEDRVHGYSACRLEIPDEGDARIHIWPRRIVQRGGWQFEADTEYNLMRHDANHRDEVEPLALPLRRRRQRRPERANPAESDAGPEPAGAVLVDVPPPISRTFVGRRELVEELRGRLLRGENVAVWSGLPGVGKTALALRLARDEEIQEHFTHILWTNLGKDPDIMPRLLALARGLNVSPALLETLDTYDALAKEITNQIGERRVLLIVDDAWNGPDPDNPGEVAVHFKLGPDGTTSRLLTTRVEAVAKAFSSPYRATALDTLTDDESLELMSQLAPTAMERAPERARECIKVAGGLPLTVILIARYLEDAASGPADELETALDRVIGDANWRVQQRAIGALPPHEWQRQNLDAAIKLTDDRLTPECRAALSSLSVFPPRANTFSRAAADRVTQIDRAVHELRQYGLVDMVTHTPERYTMHQAISDYARQGRHDASAYQRMADYFIDYAESSHDGPSKQAWLEGLEFERANIDAALQWVERSGNAPTGLRLIAALGEFWYERSRFTEGKQWIGRMLAMPAAASSDVAALRATALNWLGNFAYSQADLSEALDHYEQSLELRREHDEYAVAGTLNNIALIARERGEVSRAEGLLREAQAINLDAERYYEENGREKLRRLHRNWRGRNLNNLGRCAERRGDTDEASDLQRRSWEIFEELEYPWGIAMAACDLGLALRRAGDSSGARDVVRASFLIRYDIKDVKGIASSLIAMAALEADRSNVDAAERYLQVAVKLSLEVGVLGDMALALADLGALRFQQGDAETAAVLVTVAEKFRDERGFIHLEPARRDLERLRSELRRVLTPESYAAVIASADAGALVDVARDAVPPELPSVDELAATLRAEVAPVTAGDDR